VAGIADTGRLAVRDAVRHIRSSPIVAGVAVLAVAVALCIGALFVFVQGNTARVLAEVGKDLSVTVYLDPLISETETTALRAEVEAKVSDGLVLAGRYFTAEQEKARIISLLSEDLLEGVDDEAIPSQPVVEAKFVPGLLNESRFEQMRAWSTELKGMAGVEDIGFDADHVGIIFAIGDLVGLAGWIIGLIALLVAIFFLAQLVWGGLRDREAEVTLLRAVGATERHLYAPFFVIGVLVGVVGAVVGALIAMLIDGRLAALDASAPTFGVDLSLFGPTLIAGFVVVGALLGVLGAWASVHRHRKLLAS
jgi:cell division transport system permease protein